MPTIGLGQARVDRLMSGGCTDQHGQHPVPLSSGQPAVQLGTGVLAHGSVDDHRAGPVGEVTVEEVGRVHHRHEWERSRRVGPVRFSVDVVEDEPVDLYGPKPGQSRGGDAVGLIRGAGLLRWGQAVEQDTMTGAGQKLGGRCGPSGGHPPSMSAIGGVGDVDWGWTVRSTRLEDLAHQLHGGALRTSSLRRATSPGRSAAATRRCRSP